SPAVAEATNPSHGVRMPSAISCSSSPRAVLARWRCSISWCMSVAYGSGSHIVDLEDVSEGGRFDGWGDRERADRPTGGDAVAGVDAVVATDDRLQRGTGPQRAGDAADTGTDLRIPDRH